MFALLVIYHANQMQGAGVFVIQGQRAPGQIRRQPEPTALAKQPFRDLQKHGLVVRMLTGLVHQAPYCRHFGFWRRHLGPSKAAHHK